MALEFQKPEDDEIEDREDETRQPGHDGEQDEPDDGEGEGADETSELDEDQGQEEVDAKPEKPVSRGERRFQVLSQEAREAKEEAARVRRELDELKARQASREQPREPTAEEMALWSSDQIIEHRVSKGLAPMQQTLQQLQFQTYETGDKAAFTALCARDPRAARMAQDVEARLAQERAKGINIPREALFTFMLGERIVKQGPKARETQRRAGQTRIDRQTTKPASSRSDQSSDTRRQLSEAEARNKRLQDAGFFEG